LPTNFILSRFLDAGPTGVSELVDRACVEDATLKNSVDDFNNDLAGANVLFLADEPKWKVGNQTVNAFEKPLKLLLIFLKAFTRQGQRVEEWGFGSAPLARYLLSQDPKQPQLILDYLGFEKNKEMFAAVHQFCKDAVSDVERRKTEALIKSDTTA